MEEFGGIKLSTNLMSDLAFTIQIATKLDCILFQNKNKGIGLLEKNKGIRNNYAAYK